jgi:hypothetical protein
MGVNRRGLKLYGYQLCSVNTRILALHLHSNLFTKKLLADVANRGTKVLNWKSGNATACTEIDGVPDLAMATEIPHCRNEGSLTTKFILLKFCPMKMLHCGVCR